MKKALILFALIMAIASIVFAGGAQQSSSSSSSTSSAQAQRYLPSAANIQTNAIAMQILSGTYISPGTPNVETILRSDGSAETLTFRGTELLTRREWKWSANDSYFVGLIEIGNDPIARPYSFDPQNRSISLIGGAYRVSTGGTTFVEFQLEPISWIMKVDNNQLIDQTQPPVVAPPPAVAPPPLPPAVRYTVAINNQQSGPYDLAQLQQMAQQGTLTRETLVWREGMAQWQEAGTVQDLAGLFAAVPPPLPPAVR